MSDSVEKKVYELLNRPTRSPYGNPIPGLDVLARGNPEQPSTDEGVDSTGERNLAFPGLVGLYSDS